MNDKKVELTDDILNLAFLNHRYKYVENDEGEYE